MSYDAITVAMTDLPLPQTPAVAAAVAEAEAHAEAHYAAGRNTLVDQFTPDELADWDGSDERALVGTLAPT